MRGTPPAALELGDERDARVGPGDALKPHLRLHHFRGLPVNGAFTEKIASRFGTCFLGSPSSSASAQTIVVGSAVFHAIARGPCRHAVDGNVLGQRQVGDLLDRFSRARLQTSTSFANASEGRSRENGRFEARDEQVPAVGRRRGALSMMPGRPTFVRRPLDASMYAS